MARHTVKSDALQRKHWVRWRTVQWVREVKKGEVAEKQTMGGRAEPFKTPTELNVRLSRWTDQKQLRQASQRRRPHWHPPPPSPCHKKKKNITRGARGNAKGRTAVKRWRAPTEINKQHVAVRFSLFIFSECSFGLTKITKAGRAPAK